MQNSTTSNKNNVFREFCKYASLSVLAMAAISCYILADTFFISAGLGADGLTALNLAIPVYNFIHGTGLMLGMGGATRFAVCRSRSDHAGGNAMFTATLWLGAAFSLLFVALGILCPTQLAQLLGADGVTLPMTRTYLQVLLLFSPAFILNDILLCFNRNDGAPQLSMAATVSGSLANILLDYVFIFPCGMGMFGAVLATGLAPVIGVGVSSLHFLRKKNSYRPAKILPKPAHMRYNFALGFPSLVEQLSAAIVIIVFNYIILGLEGNAGVAAYGVVANISLVVSAVFTGIAQGMQPLLSRAHGEGDEKRAGRIFTYASCSMLALAVLLYAAVFFFAAPIAAIFNGDGNAAFGEMAAHGLRLYFLAAAFVGGNTLLCAYFTSVERALPAHILSLLRGLVVIIPCAFLFAAIWKITGVWLSYPATEALVCAVGFVLFFLNHAKTKKARPQAGPSPQMRQKNKRSPIAPFHANK